MQRRTHGSPARHSRPLAVHYRMLPKCSSCAHANWAAVFTPSASKSCGWVHAGHLAAKINGVQMYDAACVPLKNALAVLVLKHVLVKELHLVRSVPRNDSPIQHIVRIFTLHGEPCRQLVSEWPAVRARPASSVCLSWCPPATLAGAGPEGRSLA